MKNLIFSMIVFLLPVVCLGEASYFSSNQAAVFQVFNGEYESYWAKGNGYACAIAKRVNETVGRLSEVPVFSSFPANLKSDGRCWVGEQIAVLRLGVNNQISSLWLKKGGHYCVELEPSGRSEGIYSKPTYSYEMFSSMVRDQDYCWLSENTIAKVSDKKYKALANGHYCRLPDDDQSRYQQYSFIPVSMTSDGDCNTVQISIPRKYLGTVQTLDANGDITILWVKGNDHYCVSPRQIESSSCGSRNWCYKEKKEVRQSSIPFTSSLPDFLIKDGLCWLPKGDCQIGNHGGSTGFVYSKGNGHYCEYTSYDYYPSYVSTAKYGANALDSMISDGYCFLPVAFMVADIFYPGIYKSLGDNTFCRMKVPYYNGAPLGISTLPVMQYYMRKTGLPCS